MYNDVPRNSKFYNAIEFLLHAGIMIGDGNGSFHPTSTVSWADAFVILYNFSTIYYPKHEIKYEYDSEFDQWFDKENKDFFWAKPYIYYFATLKLASDKELWSRRLNTSVSINWLVSFLKSLDSELDQISDRLPHYFYSEKMTRENFAFVLYTAIQTKATIIENTIERHLQNGQLSSALSKMRSSSFYFPCFHPDFARMADLLLDVSPNSDLYIKFIHNLILYKQSLQIDKLNADPIYHYTSLGTLESLSSGNNFRAYHTEYLNDPNEGKLIISLLESYNLEKRYPGWLPLKKHSSGVFLVSFISNSRDSLPMWSQYGGQYAGCCLEFDPSTIPYELYNVIYDESVFKGRLDAIFQILDQYKIALEQRNLLLDIHSDPVFLFAESILNFIRYLYKDKAFVNEQEVRLLIFDDLRSAYAEDKIRPGESFPRIFKEIDLPRLDEHIATSPISIQRIYLGPKVYKPNWVKISLVQRNYPASCITNSAVELQ